MKVNDPVVTNLPQHTEPESCEAGKAAAAPASSDTASTVKTAVKLGAIAADQFEKFASTSGALAKFAPAAGNLKYGLKGVGAGITAALHYDKATSTSTAGKLAESGLAGGMAAAVSMSPMLPVDLVTGGEVSKGLIASTSAGAGLAEAVVTGETAGLEKLQEKMRAGEHGWFGRQLAKLGDATGGEAGVYLADKLESFNEALKDDDKK